MSEQATPAPDRDPDPLEAIEDFEPEDPMPEPITDPNHPDYVAPAAGIKPRKRA